MRPPGSWEDFNFLPWIANAALSLVVFLLAWGAKDLKSKVDKIPEHETKLAVIMKELEYIRELLEKKP